MVPKDLVVNDGLANSAWLALSWAMELARTVSDSSAGQRFNILSVAGVLDLPDPEWQIRGVLELGALGCVFGPPGEGKSFLTLDWALCIAAGVPWHGRAVVPGRVVYIAAEGGRGIKKRIRAWLRQHSLNDVPNAFVLLDSIELRDDVSALIERINDLGIGPTLIVLDTLARSFSGDENSSADMGAYIRAAQRLQDETARGRCTVVLVHHTGKREGKGARGSSALLAGVDVMISVAKNADHVVTIKNAKQKDDAAFTDITLRLTTVDIGESLGGERITSCVLEPSEATGAAGKVPVLSTQHKEALRVLVELGEAQTGRWRQEIGAQSGTAIPADTFDKWRKALVERGHVERMDSKPPRYRTTHLGASAIGAPTSANHTEPSSVSHATTPVGVAEAAEGEA
jgi:hypothetical protein